MNFEISFIDGDQIAVVKTSGHATREGFDAFPEAVMADPRWRRGMSILGDHRELDMSGLSAQDIRDLGNNRLLRGGAIGAGRLAIVASTPAAFGLARMAENYGEGVMPCLVRAFKTTDEALAWLREKSGAG